MAAVQYFTRNNQPKTSSMMEGGWDRPHNRARTLRECDGNDKHLSEGNDDDDDDEYHEDGNIPNNSMPPAESIMHLHHASQCASMPSC
jgi:hypothetical protein